MSFFLENEQATLAFAQAFAKNCPVGLKAYLYGDLGAGKTTFVRGVVQAFLPIQVMFMGVTELNL